MHFRPINVGFCFPIIMAKPDDEMFVFVTKIKEKDKDKKSCYVK